MKAKNLFIFGLAAALLSGCGGPKKYSQEANKEKFAEIVEKALDDSGMMGKEDQPFYSFEYEYAYEKDSEQKLLKDGKTLSEGKSHTKSSRSAEYDAKSALLKNKSESDSASTSPEGKSTTFSKTDIQWQTDSKNYYKVDKLEKRYQKKESEKPADAIENQAFNVLATLNSKFNYIETLVEDKNSKVYADGNVYTIVVDSNETTEGVAIKIHNVYQISITNTELEYYEETSDEEKELNAEGKTTSKTTMKLVKKDLALKALDLNDYLLNKTTLY